MRRFLPFALLLLGACSFSKDTGQADAAITDFHRALNAGQFQQIYDGSAPMMKQLVQPASFDRFLDMVHRKLGDYQSGQQVGWNDTVTTGGHMVAINYQSKFAHGAALEQFTFAIGGGKATLGGYHVNSDVLMQ